MNIAPEFETFCVKNLIKVLNHICLVYLLLLSLKCVKRKREMNPIYWAPN